MFYDLLEMKVIIKKKEYILTFCLKLNQIKYCQTSIKSKDIYVMNMYTKCNPKDIDFDDDHIFTIFCIAVSYYTLIPKRVPWRDIWYKNIYATALWGYIYFIAYSKVTARSVSTNKVWECDTLKQIEKSNSQGNCIPIVGQQLSMSLAIHKLHYTFHVTIWQQKGKTNEGSNVYSMLQKGVSQVFRGCGP